MFNWEEGQSIQRTEDGRRGAEGGRQTTGDSRLRPSGNGAQGVEKFDCKWALSLVSVFLL